MFVLCIMTNVLLNIDGLTMFLCCRNIGVNENDN